MVRGGDIDVVVHYFSLLPRFSQMITTYDSGARRALHRNDLYDAVYTYLLAKPDFAQTITKTYQRVFRLLYKFIGNRYTIIILYIAGTG